MQTGWEELVGSKAGGGYLLRELIGSTDRSAVYRTFRGEEPTALKLVNADEEPAARPQFDHPQLIRLYSSGQVELEGTPFRYFVMEPADENLASVIAARALSEDETRSMLVPLLEALSYLHELGLAHGRIRPSNILAVGDSVKLSSDSVRSIGAVASPEEDMRALGLTIIEVLTQERQASAIARVHSPLREIVEHSLQPDPASRWTARQALAHLSGELPVVAPAAPRTPILRLRRLQLRPCCAAPGDAKSADPHLGFAGRGVRDGVGRYLCARRRDRLIIRFLTESQCGGREQPGPSGRSPDRSSAAPASARAAAQTDALRASVPACCSTSHPSYRQSLWQWMVRRGGQLRARGRCRAGGGRSE